MGALKKLVLKAVSKLPRRLRDRWVLGRVHADVDHLGDVVVKVAETPEEHEQASRLLHRAYVDTGLLEQTGVPVRVTPYLLLPSTVRFVALVGGRVVATLSLVQDSSLGLPMEAACGDEVQALRARGERVAEIGALGVEPAHRKHGLTLLLYKAMWKTAVEVLGVRHLVVGVCPEAALFYAATLRFERLATTQRRYPGINGDLAALHLDLGRAEAEFERVFGRSPTRHFNPYDFFVQTTHPQLRLPASVERLERLQASHQQAALRLACLRPDAVMALSSSDFGALQHAFRPPSPAPAP